MTRNADRNPWRAVWHAMRHAMRRSRENMAHVVRWVGKGIVRIASHVAESKPGVLKAIAALLRGLYGAASGGLSGIVTAMRPRGKATKRDYAIRRAVVGVGAMTMALLLVLCVGLAIGAFRTGSAGFASDAGSTAVRQAGGSVGEPAGGSTSGNANGGSRDGGADGGSDDSAGDGADATATSGDAGKAAKSKTNAAAIVDNDADALDKAALAVSDAQRTALLDKARKVAAASGKTRREVTYCVGTKGNVGDAAAFAVQAYEALNGERGWARAGVTFVQAGTGQVGSGQVSGQSGECGFTLVLSEAQYLPAFSEGCSAEYSCRVGDDVIINWDRWRAAAPSWTGANGTLRRYRMMVVNHEVGHWLGHTDNETPCGGEGQPAPLMQQQSKGMDGCTPNEWPLDSELWTR